VSADIDRLRRLQELDLELDRLTGIVEGAPASRRALQAKLDAAQGKVDAAQGRVKDAQDARSAKEKELESSEEKRRALQGELNTIKDNKIYRAKIAEIEASKEKAGDIEGEILGLMDEVDTARREAKAAQAVFDEYKKGWEAEAADLEKEIEKAQSELTGLQAKRPPAADGIDRDLLSRYQQLRRARGGRAIAPVVRNACPSCGTGVRPQMIQLLKQGTAQVCESCGVILMWDEES
jgi:predicted  nucleic acid-binding Zn-ribbon protein